MIITKLSTRECIFNHKQQQTRYTFVLVYYLVYLCIKFFLLPAHMHKLRIQVTINERSELMMFKYANVFVIAENRLAKIANTVSDSEC